MTVERQLAQGFVTGLTFRVVGPSLGQFVGQPDYYQERTDPEEMKT